ncbi:Glutamate racemase [Pseudoalteromonas holothuriae]|uniref:Glutamate racemase n=1 Tax=Pseudoalteromonas holothuriae TaxID=2963714 RepID=A0A9W4R4L2_9GAMM|nr:MULTISPECIES: glutamate racemase [unclassified Pseudoalteromonas]CAH9066452.1 Glutamate racemase [Pseudoalteromonas sp. CIP111854]CAH9067515.1 Glutamate racemase [Pseudoalteromonas sp. CIP111951]
MPHILVFDSGVGGTSVLEHIQAQLPYAEYSYVMDNALLPYGLQSEQTIQARLACLVKQVNLFHCSVDLIVIACNTASTHALAATREITDIPIVGVVPAIKPAAESSRKKHIALLATPATSNNTYTNSLIREYAKGCQVDLHHSTHLVSFAEQLYWYQNFDIELLYSELEQINISPQVDCIVLGCTHFPILRAQLKLYYGEGVELIDSGVAIAKRVGFLLNDKLGYQKPINKRPLHFYATAPNNLTGNTNIVLRAINLNC